MTHICFTIGTYGWLQLPLEYSIWLAPWTTGILWFQLNHLIAPTPSWISLNLILLSLWRLAWMISLQGSHQYNLYPFFQLIVTVPVLYLMSVGYGNLGTTDFLNLKQVNNLDSRLIEEESNLYKLAFLELLHVQMARCSSTSMYYNELITNTFDNYICMEFSKSKPNSMYLFCIL